METHVYRKSAGGGVQSRRGVTDLAWHPGLFYPRISAEELAMWTHWLPTANTFKRHGSTVPISVISILTDLHASPEVLEECHWSWQMELFEAYELRTPTRRDLRDPLLIGRQGGECYRIALWGESLQPLEEVHELVQQSLAMRRRAARWWMGIMAGGPLVGLGLGLLIGNQSWYAGTPVEASLAYGLFGLIFTWIPAQAYTPENRQQNFLDRYRR
jgi:hypothetical protein